MISNVLLGHMTECSMQSSDGHKSCNILLAKVTLDNDKHHMAESSKGSSDEHRSSNLLIEKGALNMYL